MASDPNIALRVDLGVVTEYSLFRPLLVLPSPFLFDVDGNQDFVYPFNEVGVVVVSVLDPLGKSGEALAVNGVDSLVCLFIAQVVANLVVCRSFSFCNIL